jgi:hypothetical protein
MSTRVNGSAVNGHTRLDGEQFNGKKSEPTASKGPRRWSSGGAMLDNLSVFAKRRPDGARLGVGDLLTSKQRSLLDLSNSRINVRGTAVDAADEAALQDGIAASLKEARPQAAPWMPRRPTGDTQTPASGSRPPVPSRPQEVRRTSAGGDRPSVPPRPTTLPRQNSVSQHNPMYGHRFPTQGFGGTPRAASDDSGPLPNPWDTRPQPQAQPRPQGASAEPPRPAAPQARPSPSASARPQASPGPQKTAEAAKPKAAPDASAPLVAKDPKEVLSAADEHDPEKRWSKLTNLSRTVKQESAHWDDYMKTFHLWRTRVQPTQAQTAEYVKNTTTLQQIDSSRDRLKQIEGEIKNIGINKWALKWHPDKLVTDNGVMKTINGEAQTANDKREKTLNNLNYPRGLLTVR